MVRILNILLLLIVLVGGVFAWRARSEFDAVHREYSRLTAKVGRLPIGDETKVHVRALDADDPLDFVWQVYLPAQFKGIWRTDDFTGGYATNSVGFQDARMERVRVRFRKIDGQWYAWYTSFSGSGLHTVQQGALLDQPDMISARQFGKDDVEVVNSDQVATLLEVTAKPIPNSPDREEPLFSVRFGSQNAWAKLPSGGK